MKTTRCTCEECDLARHAASMHLDYLRGAIPRKKTTQNRRAYVRALAAYARQARLYSQNPPASQF